MLSEDRAANLATGNGDPSALYTESSDSELLVETIEVVAADVGDDAGAQGWTTAGLIGLAIAVACSLFVFLQMRPDLLFSNTTPAGGDMGAHVWGPAFLRDHLIGQFRLSGWTPDWYAGFPAYHFYMVVPSLAIVALNAGFPLPLAVPLAVLLIGIALWLTRRSEQERRIRYGLLAVVVAVLIVSIPYGVAFKLISVSGLVTFPLAAWAMGRLARAPEPIPAFLSIASLFFLFDTNFTIYGGNVASTLAGEFAFSISLTLTTLAIGLAIRGMDDQVWRARSAIVISLIALTHLIPVFFAITALVALTVMGRRVPRMWPVAVGIALALIPIAFADGTSGTVTLLAVVAAVVTFGAVILAEPEVKGRALWLVVTGATAVLLSGFWLLPFYLREPFFNDMGWERLNEVGPAMLTVPMKIALPLAAVGVVGALAMRERVGLVFTTTGMVFAAGVANLGEGPLWNARLLPFFYLSIYFLAAIGSAFVVRYAAIAMTESFDRPDQRVTVSASLVALLAGLVAVSIPLRIVPFATTNDDGTYSWLAFTSHEGSFLPSWTAWNYSGYESKPSYREYRDVVLAMERIGEVNGCGRAMWEYSPDLDRYGTPMALMLLPHWTDGCIGSMEGLYFESSSSTPFHFLNQSRLSQEPSRAQRDLPYQTFDIDRGVSELQVSGVKYYMAQTDDSIEAARQNPDLTEVGEAQPFVIFEVSGSELVEALSYEPVVVGGPTEEQTGDVANRFDVGWLQQAVEFYNDPDGFQALPAEDGPADWQRVVSMLATDGEPVEPNAVSDIRSDNSSISFSVDRIGTPVLVKASYFPNWGVEGAEGPWRVGPNLMAVVPTQTSVTMHYGRTLVDWLGIMATLAGLAALAWLVTLGRRRRVLTGTVEVWGDNDEAWTDRDLAAVGAAAHAADDSAAETVDSATNSETEHSVSVGSNGGDPGSAEVDADDQESPAFSVDPKLSTEIGRDNPPAP